MGCFELTSDRALQRRDGRLVMTRAGWWIEPSWPPDGEFDRWLEAGVIAEVAMPDDWPPKATPDVVWEQRRVPVGQVGSGGPGAHRVRVRQVRWRGHGFEIDEHGLVLCRCCPEGLVDIRVLLRPGNGHAASPAPGSGTPAVTLRDGDPRAPRHKTEPSVHEIGF